MLSEKAASEIAVNAELQSGKPDAAAPEDKIGTARLAGFFADIKRQEQKIAADYAKFVRTQ